MKKNNKTDKVIERLPVGMQEELDNCDPRELNERIAKSATIVSETLAQMKEDPDVFQAKSVLKNLEEPYKDTVKAQNAVIDYSIRLLKQKGKL